MHYLDYITIGIAFALAVSLIAAYAFGSLPLPPRKCGRCYQGGGKRAFPITPIEGRTQKSREVAYSRRDWMKLRRESRASKPDHPPLGD